MIGIVNYRHNEIILKKWCEESTKLKLKNIKQILFYNGRHTQENIIDEDEAWFLLEMTDEQYYGCLEIQINTSAEMGLNTLNVKTIYEYFKNLMYVDKKEWVDFFGCIICRKLNDYYLVCESC